MDREEEFRGELQEQQKQVVCGLNRRKPSFPVSSITDATMQICAGWHKIKEAMAGALSLCTHSKQVESRIQHSEMISSQKAVERGYSSGAEPRPYVQKGPALIPRLSS